MRVGHRSAAAPLHLLLLSLCLLLATAAAHGASWPRSSNVDLSLRPADAASFVQRRQFGSLRAERERLELQRRQDAIYEENLRKFKQRTEAFRVPREQVAQLLAPRAMAAQAQAQAQAQGPVRAADHSPEVAQVESLIQMTEKPTLTLRHGYNTKAPLTLDALHGRGMHNPANRAATQAGLEAHPDNRPPAPAFVPLPPTASAATQPADTSFLATRETQRPAYMGPPTAQPPSPHVTQPSVLPGSAPAPSAAPAQRVSEEQFVAGLPPAFMELDAATQLHILALVDAGVDVGADAEAEAKADAQAEADAEADAETETDADADSEAESESESESGLDEAELSDAAGSLNALAMLQRESKVPLRKLVRLLAAKGKAH